MEKYEAPFKFWVGHELYIIVSKPEDLQVKFSFVSFVHPIDQGFDFFSSPGFQLSALFHLTKLSIKLKFFGSVLSFLGCIPTFQLAHFGS
jgi:hypothetical protein